LDLEECNNNNNNNNNNTPLRVTKKGKSVVWRRYRNVSVYWLVKM
jgi:hypothetical protein